MQQRIMIAMALSCRPRIMIADEPTTALDVTIQAQILYLMKALQRTIGTSIIFITHDLGVIARMARKVVVMYAGKIVESCNVFDLFENPLHPYTKALLESIPAGRKGAQSNRFLRVIPGAVPNLANLPKGCAFSPRCADAWDFCRQKSPDAFRINEDRIVNCWKYAN
jgi:oligopeptide/dipeptide ABC transporter ATP-binding protein